MLQDFNPSDPSVVSKSNFSSVRRLTYYTMEYSVILESVVHDNTRQLHCVTNVLTTKLSDKPKLKAQSVQDSSTRHTCTCSAWRVGNNNSIDNANFSETNFTIIVIRVRLYSMHVLSNEYNPLGKVVSGQNRVRSYLLLFHRGLINYGDYICSTIQ